MAFAAGALSGVAARPLPVVAGAYLGHWLDGMLEGYSMRWTLSLIVTGLVVGAINVWLLIRD